MRWAKCDRISWTGSRRSWRRQREPGSLVDSASCLLQILLIDRDPLPGNLFDAFEVISFDFAGFTQLLNKFHHQFRIVDGQLRHGGHDVPSIEVNHDEWPPHNGMQKQNRSKGKR